MFKPRENNLLPGKACKIEKWLSFWDKKRNRKEPNHDSYCLHNRHKKRYFQTEKRTN